MLCREHLLKEKSMVYAGMAGKRRTFNRAAQNQPLLVFVFASKGEALRYAVSPLQWHDLPDCPLWEGLRIFVSEYDTEHDQLRRPRQSIPDLSAECTRLFETEFHRQNPRETYLYPGIFALLERMGFDKEVRILLRHRDGSSTQYQIINGNPHSMAESA
jgi:hypothetical protein